jgi:hypothetical protein
MNENLRPSVKVEIFKETTLRENFQNKVLRPLLKMKNAEILQIINFLINKEHWPLQNMSLEEKTQYIQKQLSNHRTAKPLLMGLILGNMSPAEISFFLENYNDCKKRFLQMVTQRVADQI